MLVDEVFMERFDRANHLADAGDYQQALEAYNNILAPSAGTVKKAITGEFLATVELRKAYCLSDLGRYPEALAVYQAMDTSDRAGQFDDDRLYEYYFSYGNLLGQLGQFDEMIPRLTQAVNIAANHAKADQVADSWRWLMHWGMVAEEWQWLLDTAEQARVFGMSSSNMKLQLAGIELKFYALRGLGELNQAREIAQIMLSLVQGLNLKEKITEWEMLLASVSDEVG